MNKINTVYPCVQPTNRPQPQTTMSTTRSGRIYSAQDQDASTTIPELDKQYAMLGLSRNDPRRVTLLALRRLLKQQDRMINAYQKIDGFLSRKNESEAGIGEYYAIVGLPKDTSHDVIRAKYLGYFLDCNRYSTAAFEVIRDLNISRGRWAM
jgi:hypothetical protein